MKSKIYFIYSLFLLPVFLLSCSQQVEPLKIAAHKWPGYELMFLAERENWFDTSAAIITETNSATESLYKLKQGEVDGAALTLDEVLRARAEGLPLTVVLAFDKSAGADVVIADKNIKKLSAIKGKKIGVEKTAVGGLMLYKLLESSGISEKDVVIVDSSIDQHVADWDNNEFDVVITYEPMASIILQKEGHQVFDSRNAPDMIFDVLAIRDDVLDTKKNAIEELVAGHFKSLNHMRKNPNDAAYRMAAHLGLSGAQVLDSFRGLELPAISVNRQYLSDGGKIESAVKELQKVMIKQGMLTKQDSMHNLVSNKFIPDSK